jgi:hypothetical protein
LQGAVAEAAAELGGIRLPDDFELLDVAGQGSCAITFRAAHRGETVAVKAYRPRVAERYRKNHDLNIAVYEMSRNREFRKDQSLFPFSARPIMVLGHDGRLSLCFVQEYIEGTPLTELAPRNRGVPASVLDAGKTIVGAAEKAGLEELDLDYRNVILREQKGRWLPVIHDFNHIPGEKPGGLAGLFKGKPRDNRQMVDEWFEFSRQCAGD